VAVPNLGGCCGWFETRMYYVSYRERNINQSTTRVYIEQKIIIEVNKERLTKFKKLK
jgi:hypothetical protein